mmetsp:Transcript_1437/g.4166  ORF Transcript_1437/g.4166 Transcript_1437/m.4166 type:complete len:295 (-) Transcript_1437:939-1823(-)
MSDAVVILKPSPHRGDPSGGSRERPQQKCRNFWSSGSSKPSSACHRYWTCASLSLAFSYVACLRSSARSVLGLPQTRASRSRQLQRDRQPRGTTVARPSRMHAMASSASCIRMLAMRPAKVFALSKVTCLSAPPSASGTSTPAELWYTKDISPKQSSKHSAVMPRASTSESCLTLSAAATSTSARSSSAGSSPTSNFQVMRDNDRGSTSPRRTQMPMSRPRNRYMRLVAPVTDAGATVHASRHSPELLFWLGVGMNSGRLVVSSSLVIVSRKSRYRPPWSTPSSPSYLISIGRP